MDDLGVQYPYFKLYLDNLKELLMITEDSLVGFPQLNAETHAMSHSKSPWAIFRD